MSPKLRMPERRPADVPRPRVVRALGPIGERRVSIVVAPAGYGKTLAVAERLLASERPVVWVAIDPSDDDLATFVSIVASGLSTHAPGAGDLATRLVATEGAGPGGERVGLLLASEIAAALPAGVVLVLDDAHVLASAAVWEAVAGLVRHPTPLRLVFVAQVEPPLPLERLRGADEVFVATREIFPFDADELARAAEARMGRRPDDAFLSDLAARTDGWPALVRIALAAMAEPGAGPLYGAAPQLGRFLREEVHGRLGALARTIFDEIAVLSEPAESIVLGLHPGEAVGAAIAELERVGLVARHGSGEGAVLRPNPVAASLAEERARGSDGRRLHARAAGVARALGDLDAAIAHLRAAGDDDGAAEAIAKEGPRRLAAGAAETVLRWTESMSEAAVAARPEISYLRGEALLRRGRASAAEVELSRAVRLARDRGDPAVLSRALAAVCTLRDEAGEFEAARALGREAVEAAPATDLATQAVALFASSRAEYHGGSAEIGVEQGERAFDLAIRAGDPALAVRIAVGIGVAVLRLRGWDAASALLDDAREIASGAGLPFELVAMESPIEERLLLDAGDLEKCLDVARRRAALLDRVGDAAGAALARIEEGLALCLLDRSDEALAVAKVSGEVLRASGGEPVVHELLWLRAEALAAAGRFDEADGVVAEGLSRSEAGGLRVARPFYLAFRASIAIRKGDLAPVERWLDEATPLFEQGGIRALGRTWLPLLRAELALARGKEDEAARHLDLAFVESRRTGATAILFDGTQMAARLLAFAEEKGLHPEYVAETRARLPHVRAQKASVTAPAAPSRKIRLQLLGSLQIWRAGDAAPARWHSLKGRDLLAYLLLSRRRAVGRAELVDAIWPDAELERGRPLLRFHLFHLRRTLSDDATEGKRLVWSAGDECGIEPGRLVTDLEEMEAGLAEARAATGREALSALERAVARWGGPLCQNLDYPWVIGPRERVRVEYRAALRRIAALQTELGSPLEAEATLRLALSEDRTDEESARRLIALLVDRGDRTGALGVFRAIERALDDDLGVGPDEQTLRVARPVLRR